MQGNKKIIPLHNYQLNRCVCSDVRQQERMMTSVNRLNGYTTYTVNLYIHVLLPLSP